MDFGSDKMPFLGDTATRGSQAEPMIEEGKEWGDSHIALLSTPVAGTKVNKGRE